MRTITKEIGPFILFLSLFIMPNSGWGMESPSGPESIIGLWTWELEQELKIEILVAGNGTLVGRLVESGNTQKQNSNGGKILLNEIKIDGAKIECKVNYKLILNDDRPCVPEDANFKGQVVNDGMKIEGELESFLILDDEDGDCEVWPEDEVTVLLIKEEECDENYIADDAVKEEVLQKDKAFNCFTFKLKGPEEVKWGSETKYELVYEKDGKQKKWFGNVKWDITNDNPEIKLSSKSSSERTLHTPTIEKPFLEIELKLQVRPIGNIGGKSVPSDFIVGVQIKISNVAESCEIVEKQINALKERHFDFLNEIEKKRDELKNIRIPLPWNETERYRPGKKLEGEITKLESDYEEAKQAAAASEKGLKALYKTRSELINAQKKLWRSTTEVGRALWAKDRFDNSKKEKEDMLQFLHAYKGTGSGIPKTIRSSDLKDTFDIWYEDAKKKIGLRLGWSLIQIGGIAMAGLPGPGNYSGINTLFMLGLGIYVDKKIDSSEFIESLNLSTSALKSLSLQFQGIVNLAKQIENMSKANASSKKIDKLKSKLHRMILIAHDETGEAIRLMNKVILKAKQLKSKVEKLHRETEAQLKKAKSLNQNFQKEFSKEKSDYPYKRMAAFDKKKELESLIKDLEQRIADNDKELEKLNTLKTRYCDTPEKEKSY